MAVSVAVGAECNQIVRHVPAKLAPKLDVMNLQVLHGAAVLAPPTISFQHLVPDNGVLFRLEFESWLFFAQAHRIC